MAASFYLDYLSRIPGTDLFDANDVEKAAQTLSVQASKLKSFSRQHLLDKLIPLAISIVPGSQYLAKVMEAVITLADYQHLDFAHRDITAVILLASTGQEYRIIATVEQSPIGPHLKPWVISEPWWLPEIDQLYSLEHPFRSTAVCRFDRWTYRKLCAHMGKIQRACSCN